MSTFELDIIYSCYCCLLYYTIYYMRDKVYKES